MGKLAGESEGAPEFIEGLCFEYCEEAVSLWHLRCRAVKAPHYNLTELLELDNRLEAQIDALRVAGGPGREICAALENGGAGECFLASVLAFESTDEARIAGILDKAASLPELSEAVTSALGWLSYEQSRPHIMSLLKSKSTVHQYIGISAGVFHRQDPWEYLDNAIYSPDPLLKARALKAVGELGGRSDIMMPGRLQNNWNARDSAISFSAVWSSALRGDVKAIDTLKTFVTSASSFGEEAIGIAMRCMEYGEVLALQKELAKSPGTLRLAVQGAGIIGDPALVPWLLEQMRVPELARIAGEAFAMITGVDIAREGMEGKCPEGFSAGPNDYPDDPDVALDPDEHLAWPDGGLISAWWDKNRGRFPEGKRLLLGRPITKENTEMILMSGFQRQRAAAALELAIMEKGKPLYNICAPAWRQLPTEAKAAPGSVPVKVNYGPRMLAVTAVNCITPVGLDAAMTAASVRAGITRLAIHEEYRDAGGSPVIAAKIRGIQDDEKDTVERLEEIAEICLEDLLGEYFHDVPKHDRSFHGYLLLGVASENRPGPDYGKEYLESLLAVTGGWIANHAGEVITKGNASLHYAIKDAARIIAGNPDKICIIGGVDSLLRESTLSWFAGYNRLKSTGYGCHQGLPASEAVCFLILEDLERAKQAKKPILARISSLGLAQEPKPRASNKSGISTGLTEACLGAMEPLKGRGIKAIFSDLNGEESRTEEWVVAAMRCFENPPGVSPVWSPAELYGDIGAASGAVMAGVAAQGFIRNWLESPVMIFCSDDHGSCGAVILEKEG